MPFCPNCGTQLNPGFSFCPNCGFKVESINSRGTTNTNTLPSTPSLEQMDFVDKYLSLKPGVLTYESFISKVEIKGDIIAISSALESEIKPAAQSGDASAMIVLGVLHEKGFAIEQSREKAFDFLGEATGKGYPVAEWIAGLIDMEADSHFALFWDLSLSRGFQSFIKSANQGYCPAMVNLGNCCSKGKGTAQNKSEALKWYRKAADLGYAPAQYKLGRCYHGLEEGFTCNYAEAIKWYSKAASQGYAPSQNNLGTMYDNGLCVPVDHTEAAKWYKRAAEQGLDDAQYNLGNCYVYGSGVDLDYSKAKEWYKKAAEQGDARYQLNLARWLRYHPIILEDGVKYYENYNSWYKKAAEQGNAQAQYELAGLLMSDAFFSCEQTAAEWYRRAAEQGHSGAQFELGMCYVKGKGVEKDLSAAKHWIQAAADQGNKDAIEYLNR